jgi:hypothetical protein
LAIGSNEQVEREEFSNLHKGWMRKNTAPEQKTGAISALLWMVFPDPGTSSILAALGPKRGLNI